MERINKTKLILWIIIGCGVAIAITRFIFGLGVTTNLTDNTPWGFWIGFDVMGGVALAAGGFVLAAFNYIFHKNAFHPITRAAILTAFLGYIAVAVGLLFDLGLPWNIWHMIIYWNPHSPLFEVGWCVMLYLTVLFLEFAPVILERWPNIPFVKSAYNFLNKIKIPLVILGIMLSTLHQSSLGSLFLAMPYRLHPLWYSPILPVIFFTSAICLGLMMVMVENMTTSYLYKKEYEVNILNKLRVAAFWMLVIYLLLRFSDILFRGAGSFLFQSAWGTYLFWIELLLMVVIPLICFSKKVTKKSINLLYWGAMIGVIGVVFNRLNVGGLTHLNNLTNIGSFYFPSLMELGISAMVVAAAMLVFFYFIENYKIWEEPAKDLSDNPKVKPKFGPYGTYFGPTKVSNRVKFSFAFVLAFSITFATLSGTKIENKGLERIPATKARGGDTLFIDGNKDGYGVVFAHKLHSKKFNCGTCHHLNKPKDKATDCYECHSEMYTKSDAFRHDWHASAMGGNLKCFDCHNPKLSKSKQTAKKCEECHKDLISPFANSSLKNIKTYITVSYVDAMHRMCIRCHESKIKKDSLLAKQKPDLAKCKNCHKNIEKYKYTKKMFQRRKINKWVVVPGKLQ